MLSRQALFFTRDERRARLDLGLSAACLAQRRLAAHFQGGGVRTQAKVRGERERHRRLGYT